MSGLRSHGIGAPTQQLPSPRAWAESIRFCPARLQSWTDWELPAWPETTQTRLSEDGRHLTVASNRPARTLVEIVKWVDAQGIGLEDVHLARPTLEDVFIELTGKRLRE